jgi:hypothetical protein
MALPREILDVQTIYMEPAVETYDRGRQVLERYPDARRIIVSSHNAIPTLYGNEGNAEDWLRIKQHTVVLGVKKSMSMRANERSSNFIAPSTSNGCAMACAYCYVPRRKGYANPIAVFVNIEQICAALARHAQRQGASRQPIRSIPNSGSMISARTAIYRSMLWSPTTSAISSPPLATFQTPRAASRPNTSIAISLATILSARPVFASR